MLTTSSAEVKKDYELYLLSPKAPPWRAAGPLFTPEKRVQTKVTEFHNLKGKTADMLTTYILHKYKLSDKIIAFCGDNFNTNF
jgi:hypothetical protein